MSTRVCCAKAVAYVARAELGGGNVTISGLGRTWRDALLSASYLQEQMHRCLCSPVTALSFFSSICCRKLAQKLTTEKLIRLLNTLAERHSPGLDWLALMTAWGPRLRARFWATLRHWATRPPSAAAANCWHSLPPPPPAVALKALKPPAAAATATAATATTAPPS